MNSFRILVNICPSLTRRQNDKTLRGDRMAVEKWIAFLVMTYTNYLSKWFGALTMSGLGQPNITLILTKMFMVVKIKFSFNFERLRGNRTKEDILSSEVNKEVGLHPPPPTSTANSWTQHFDYQLALVYVPERVYDILLNI